jgi:cytochrome c-type biogenesis protein CcmH
MTDTIDSLKDKLQQIEALRSSGALSDETAAAQRAALERQLVDLVMNTTPTAATAQLAGGGTQPSAPRSGRPSRRLWAGIAAFVLVFSAAGYMWRGNLAAWSIGPGDTRDVAAADGGASAPHAVGAQQLEAMLGTLKKRLDEHPDDADGWLMLGRSYAAMGRFDDAVPALRKVLALQPKNAQGLADLADAVAMQNQRSFEGEPKKLVQQALAADPNNLKALALAGSIAYEAKDIQAAMRYWEHGVQVGPADSSLVNAMRDNLNELRAQAGMAPLPAASGAAAGEPETAQAGPGSEAAAIQGRVELSPALAKQVGPDDTVFIFARAPEGSRMPLAILRKQVRDLPFTFTLDDSLAMSPAARLSTAAAVVVGARVSKSGQATPQPGDLQGLSGVVKPGARNVAVVIDQAVH